LDEDSVFLLCSDGLSDGDRVDEYWETEILPMLEGKTDIETVSKRLIEIANTQNGHDNVTVGLIYVQVTPSQAIASLEPMDTGNISAGTTRFSPAVPESPTQISQSYRSEPSGYKTQVVEPEQNASSRWLLLGIGALIGIAGLIGFLLWLPNSQRAIAPVASPIPSPQPSVSPSPIVTPLNSGSLVQITTKDLPLPLLELISEPIAPTSDASRQPNSEPSPTEAPSTPIVVTTIPKDAVLEVLSKRGTTQQGQWVQFRVCSAGAESGTTSIAGQKGWIRESEISAWVAPIAQATVEQRGSCIKEPSPASPSSSP
jgi:protein phosphatase